MPSQPHSGLELMRTIRELKMYNQHLAENLSGVLIQMRRNSPPSTLRGMQSLVAKSNVDDAASFSKAMSLQLSIPQSSPEYSNVQNHETNTDLNSIEIGKQALRTNGQEEAERCKETNEEPTYLADRDEWKDSSCSDSSPMTNTSIYLHARKKPICELQVCNAPINNLGHASHDENSIASGIASKTSSIISSSTQCDGSGFISSSNYSGASLYCTEELMDTSLVTTNTDQTVSAGPKDIQDVKVIFVHPQITHASHLMENVLIEEGLPFNNYLFLGQPEQYLAANGFDILYPGQLSLKDRISEGSKMILNFDTVTSLSQPLALLDTVRIPPDEKKDRRAYLSFSTCSFCKQIPPNLGKRPVKFSHNYLLLATNCFSRTNILGEDETGVTYMGLLKDGYRIAVKKFRQPYVQGDDSFLMELELLICAQHRNLMMLLGYCAEDTSLMLVYEYVCNRSLSWHLEKENNPNGLEWWARQKIAIGVARGLRYLHEESRGGCIVHGEVGADKIFLNHQFLPMIGNFGLACLQQVEKDLVEAQLDGTSGSLGARKQEVSWKTDVYAFGVVVLELISGRKASDNSFKPEQESLVDWARPLIIDGRYHELLDPRLESSYDSFELVCMVRAATWCILEHPSRRPRMSEVLHIMERGSGNNDYVEVPFSKDLQCDQKDAPDTKPQPQVVASQSSKPQKNPKRVKLPYDGML